MRHGNSSTKDTMWCCMPETNRARELRERLPEVPTVLVVDLQQRDAVIALAEETNRTGRSDAVIDNAGLDRQPQRGATAESHSSILAVNVLARYILTAQMSRPRRLIYLSSGLHRSAARHSMTSIGRGAAGMVPRPTPTANCWSPHSPSPLRDAGRTYSRTRSSPGGSPRRWRPRCDG